MIRVFTSSNLSRGQGLTLPPLLSKMARGRLGGTKAKIRGKVGSEIYQLKRDPDGTLVQSVYGQNPNPTYTNTPAQAKYRCIMGQIERMWHIIPDVIRDAYAKIDPSALAFQHFTKINYDYVVSKFSLMEGVYSSLNWKEKRDLAAPAGEWILCDGTLPEVFFPLTSWLEAYNNALDWYYNPSDDDYTLGGFLRQIGYQKGDYLRIYVFVDFADDTPATIEVIDTYLNPSLDVRSILPYPMSEDVFIKTKESEWQVLCGISRAFPHLRLRCPQDDIKRIIACATLQIIRPSDVGTLFSSCRFSWFQVPQSSIYPRKTALDVWPTWYNG